MTIQEFAAAYVCRAEELKVLEEFDLVDNPYYTDRVYTGGGRRKGRTFTRRNDKQVPEGKIEATLTRHHDGVTIFIRSANRLEIPQLGEWDEIVERRMRDDNSPSKARYIYEIVDWTYEASEYISALNLHIVNISFHDGWCLNV